MEWIVLTVMAIAAAAYVLAPRTSDREAPEEEWIQDLQAERAALLDQLRELEDDAAIGRISAGDRIEGRRALGPRLRAVTETLQQLGEYSEPFRIVRSEQSAIVPAERESSEHPGAQITESEPVEPRS